MEEKLSGNIEQLDNSTGIFQCNLFLDSYWRIGGKFRRKTFQLFSGLMFSFCSLYFLSLTFNLNNSKNIFVFSSACDMILWVENILWLSTMAIKWNSRMKLFRFPSVYEQFEGNPTILNLSRMKKSSAKKNEWRMKSFFPPQHWRIVQEN